MSKFMKAAEFRDLGLLQEINRRFLHPMGLALAARTVESSGVRRDGSRVEPGDLLPTLEILDVREDPEGMVFAAGAWEPGDHEKAASVDALFEQRRAVREAKFGWHVGEDPDK